MSDQCWSLVLDFKFIHVRIWVLSSNYRGNKFRKSAHRSQLAKIEAHNRISVDFFFWIKNFQIQTLSRLISDCKFQVCRAFQLKLLSNAFLCFLLVLFLLHQGLCRHVKFNAWSLPKIQNHQKVWTLCKTRILSKNGKNVSTPRCLSDAVSCRRKDFY